MRVGAQLQLVDAAQVVRHRDRRGDRREEQDGPSGAGLLGLGQRVGAREVEGAGLELLATVGGTALGVGHELLAGDAVEVGVDRLVEGVGEARATARQLRRQRLDVGIRWSGRVGGFRGGAPAGARVLVVSARSRHQCDRGHTRRREPTKRLFVFMQSPPRRVVSSPVMLLITPREVTESNLDDRRPIDEREVNERRTLRSKRRSGRFRGPGGDERVNDVTIGVVVQRLRDLGERHPPEPVDLVVPG